MRPLDSNPRPWAIWCLLGLLALTCIVGGLVMVLDPIFQGLAVALMSGAIVATLLTMVVVPLLYWELLRREGATS